MTKKIKPMEFVEIDDPEWAHCVGVATVDMSPLTLVGRSGRHRGYQMCHERIVAHGCTFEVLSSSVYRYTNHGMARYNWRHDLTFFQGAGAKVYDVTEITD